MATGKKSFLLYCDIITTVKKLPKDKQADLFIMILDYVNDLDPKTDDLILDIAFDPIRNQLKRDLKTYENVVERNRSNGIKGGRPQKPKKPTGLNENPSKPKEPKKAENDNDTDNDIINEDSHNNIFRKLWYSDQWIESLCMKWKCEKSDFLDHLNGFRIDCISKEELKVDEKDAKSHFVNWVNKGNAVPTQEKKYSKSTIKDNWW